MYEYLLARSESSLFIIISCSFLSVYLIRRFGLTPGGVLPSGVFVLLLLRDPTWALITLLTSIAIHLVSRLFFFSSGGLTSVYMSAIFLLSTFAVYRIVGIYSALLLLLLAIAAAALLLKNPILILTDPLSLSERFNPNIVYAILALIFAYSAFSLYSISYLQAGGLMIAPVMARHYLRNGFVSTFFSFAICVMSGCAVSILVVYISHFTDTQAIYSLNQDHLFASYYLKVIPYLMVISLSIGAAASKFNGIRAGGYILAPFAAQIITETNAALIIFFGVAGCCFFQTYIIERFTWMIGLSRYLFILILSAVYTLIVCNQYIALGLSLFIVANSWVIALIIHGVSNDIIVCGKKTLPWITLNYAAVCIAFHIFGTF